MIQKIISCAVLCIALYTLPGCFEKKQTQESLYVINVLDEDLYKDCHIKGSIQVSMPEVEEFVKRLNKDTELVIYCSNYLCTASGAVADLLGDTGFTNVYAYEAGMAEWYQKGLPVDGPCKSSYLKKVMVDPGHEEALKIKVISTEELFEKMKQAGKLK